MGILVRDLVQGKENLKMPSQTLGYDDSKHSMATSDIEAVYYEHAHTTNSIVNSHSNGHNQELVRGLKPRHVAMIAIAGSVGTGLIIGTGAGLAQAGPAPLLIAYSLVGFVVFIVMSALGEMAAWLPLPSGFTGYATRFVDPALGVALGWTCVRPDSQKNSS